MCKNNPCCCVAAIIFSIAVKWCLGLRTKPFLSNEDSLSSNCGLIRRIKILFLCKLGIVGTNICSKEIKEISAVTISIFLL